jgi:endonuclease YncB( thermonuclease family)
MKNIVRCSTALLFLVLFLAGPDAAKNPYLLGEYPLAKVVDGDTIQLVGLKGSVRVLFVDTEETAKGKSAEQKTKKIAESWDGYLAAKKQLAEKSGKPQKFDTPSGYDAMIWARSFFEGVKTVRLEVDNPDVTRDFFGRYLAYVLVEKSGKWLNFNIEAIRSGHSPYTTKYGRSIRFHNEFLAAQKEAEAKKVGVWNPTGQHYPDYSARLAWWTKRGDQIEQYRSSPHQDILFAGGSDTSYEQLKDQVGKNIKLFGLLTGLKSKEKALTFIMPFRQFREIRVDVSEKAGLNADLLRPALDYYVYLNGVLQQDSSGKYFLVVEKKEQLTLPK